MGEEGAAVDPFGGFVLLEPAVEAGNAEVDGLQAGVDDLPGGFVPVLDDEGDFGFSKRGMRPASMCRISGLWKRHSLVVRFQLAKGA